VTSRIEFLLIAGGVARFLASELREQNIVDRINAWSDGNWDESARPLLVELLTGSQTQIVLKDMEPIVEAEVEAIKQGVKLLVEIEAVYGMSALILCRSLNISS
jgi:hypothetical protein